MDRKEFIYLLGAGVGASALSTCLYSCTKSNAGPPSNVDFTLDLALSENTPLTRNGGFVYSNGIIVARTLSGSFIAVSKSCTHESVSVTYDGNNNRFFCPNHGSTFSTNGDVINGPASRPLKEYRTSLSNTLLRVFS
jgi:cytochrome b6-f complex iron-sulfur subunit